KGAAQYEYINYINVVREGGKFTVYEKAKKYYKENKNNFNLIIDEINVKPFLTPKYVKNIPVVALIHQISPEQFTHELPFPIGIIGRYILEKRWLSIYKDIFTVTVSDSTRTSLEELGFRKIKVVKEGLSVTPLDEPLSKVERPRITFIGRFKKHKLPDHAILAFKKIKKKIPNSQMYVIGDGYLLDKLKQIEVEDITFYGYINNKEKYRLLSQSHLVLVPAIREGWGLVVVESNAMGVPVVAYTVPGLVDLIKDGFNGLLVNPNTPDELANTAISLLSNPDKLETLCRKAIEYSRQFDWNTTTAEFEEMLLQYLKIKQLPSSVSL
ncbi:MAG TPA: glycosyltransferase family 4 protein, partial [Nitrososphaeraceae archaeon]|nr:glycosyltransferase family 4 protein [Nitrososphaeraceae archaeon]